MRSLIAILICILVSSCGNKKDKAAIPPPVAGETKVIAIFTLPDSSKRLDIAMRVVVDSVRYDSVRGEKVVFSKEIWGIPTMVPVKDSARNIIKTKDGRDSLQQIWVRFPSDSIKTKGIEGVSIDSLLKKSSPLQ